MSSTKTSSLFTSEVADLFRQASAQQEAINNKAAALMYAAIHRGERDIRMLEHIADPLSDAEYAGEEHYRNLIRYIATFNPTAAFHLHDFFEDVNGFKNHIIYAIICLLRTLYTDEQFATSIIPLLKTRGDWQELTVLLLGKAHADKVLMAYNAQQQLQSYIEQITTDHHLLWTMVDEYEPQNLPLPNETYHSLTTREWNIIEEAIYIIAEGRYFDSSQLTARVRILQLEAEGKKYETCEEMRQLIEYIRSRQDLEERLLQQPLPNVDIATDPMTASPDTLYLTFPGYWAPAGESFMPRSEITTLHIPMHKVSEILQDDQYLRIIPKGIPMDDNFHQPCWICEGNITLHTLA